jgi:RNA methyltransferase, TrmH family
VTQAADGAAITSRSNPRVRAAAALRDRSERDARGLTLVDGAREVGRAVASRAAIDEVFVCEELVRGDESRATVDALRSSGVPIVAVGRSAFDRLAFGDRSDGLVAVVRPPALGLETLAPRLPPDPLVVVLEALEKPGNLGAVLRSADGAGAAALIVADARTDIWNPNAIRASLGTIFAVPLAAAPSAEVIDWLEAQGVGIVAARLDGAVPYDEIDLTGRRAIALGSEANGLSDQWRRPSIVGIRLPMLGIADSLNVSTAAAVLLYESRRQRRHGDADARRAPQTEENGE